MIYRKHTKESLMLILKPMGSAESCWEWMGFRNPKGYGQMTINCKRKLVHRASYELYVGPIPKGKGFHGTCVLHKCDNPACYNPNHLYLGTNKDNIVDKINKQRQTKGVDVWCAKLTKEQVVEIRSKYIPRKYSTRRLAKEYGVSQLAIYAIVSGKTWRSV